MHVYSAPRMFVLSSSSFSAHALLVLVHDMQLRVGAYTHAARMARAAPSSNKQRGLSALSSLSPPPAFFSSRPVSPRPVSPHLSLFRLTTSCLSLSRLPTSCLAPSCHVSPRHVSPHVSPHYVSPCHVWPGVPSVPQPMFNAFRVALDGRQHAPAPNQLGQLQDPNVSSRESSIEPSQDIFAGPSMSTALRRPRSDSLEDGSTPGTFSGPLIKRHKTLADNLTRSHRLPDRVLSEMAEVCVTTCTYCRVLTVQ